MSVPQMPNVILADGSTLLVPAGAGGRPDWSAVGALALAAPDPGSSRELSVLDFRRRFTLEERAAIYTAAETNALLRAWLDDLAVATSVHLDHPDVIDALNALVQLGILTAERAEAIRA